MTKVAGAVVVVAVLTPQRVAREVVRAVILDWREAVFPWRLRRAMRLYGVAPGLAQSLMQTMGLWHRGWGQNKGAV